MNTNTIKYDPTNAQRKNNIFLEEYYSGADCNVYVDNVLCDNVAGIGFSVMEQLKPLYGYASRVFDDVAIGNRIVTGIIRIPVRNTEPTTTGYTSGTLDLSDIQEVSSVEGNQDPLDFGKYFPDGWLNDIGKIDLPDWVKDAIYTNEIQNNSKNAPSIKLTEEVVPTDIPPLNIKLTEDTNQTKPIASNSILNTQYKLALEGYDSSMNGTMDGNTRNAIIKYQKDNDLPITGIIDEKTTTSLNKEEPYKSIPYLKVTEAVDVYTGPGLQYPVLTNIPSNTLVKKINTSGTYARLLLPDGKEGYVCLIDMLNWETQQ